MRGLFTLDSSGYKKKAAEQAYSILPAFSILQPRDRLSKSCWLCICRIWWVSLLYVSLSIFCIHRNFGAFSCCEKRCTVWQCSVPVNYGFHWFCTYLLLVLFDTPQFQYWERQFIALVTHDLLLHLQHFLTPTHLLSTEESPNIWLWLLI